MARPEPERNFARPLIVVAEPHPLIAAGIRTVLSPEYDIAGLVSSSAELLEVAHKLRPEVVLLNVTLAVADGVGMLLWLRGEMPLAKWIVFAMEHTCENQRIALASAADGYAAANRSPEELSRAILAVRNGQRYGLADRDDGKRAPASENSHGLTERQLEVLRLVVAGHPSKQIAYLLGVSGKTVDFHRSRIMDRLGVRCVAELVQVAMLAGIAGPQRSRSLSAGENLQNDASEKPCGRTIARLARTG